MSRHSTPLTGTFGDSDRQRWYPSEVEDHYRSIGCWTDELIVEALDHQAKYRPHAPAVSDRNQTLSFADLAQRVEQLSAQFTSYGIAPGDRVVLQVGNHTGFIEAFFALQRIRAVPTMALVGHRLHDLDAFVRISDAVAYVGDERAPGADLRDIAADLVDRHPALVALIRSTESGNYYSLTDSPVANTESPHATASSAATDLALLQLSGGSTGTPKLIPRTHADYLFSIRESNQICRITDKTVYLCVLPAAHNFAVSSPGWLGVLREGGHVVMAPDPSAATCLPLIEEYRVTLTGIVPPVALLWLEAVERCSHEGTSLADLSSLEMVQVGGAKLSESAARRVDTVLGCQLQQVFGMAEGLVNYTRRDDPYELVVTTQGRPISPFDEIRIVDDFDNPMPEGEPGHLLTRGPYTVRGYLGGSEVNAGRFTDDGFYRTGDVVRLIGSHLQVVGRSKDQINRGGEKIAPEEVENLLLTHDDVLEAHVRGVPDDMLGERIEAWVIPRSGATLRPRQLRHHLVAAGIASYKMPDRIELCNELPRTAVGKVQASATVTAQPLLDQ